jgi:hypothetical protein
MCRGRNGGLGVGGRSICISQNSKLVGALEPFDVDRSRFRKRNNEEASRKFGILSEEASRKSRQYRRDANASPLFSSNASHGSFFRR